jgi:D-sedoheptulose 7-phosphate isomerase
MNVQTNELIERYPVLHECRLDIQDSCKRIANSLEKGNTLYICGNGGSAADAEHIAGELIKSFVISRSLDVELQEELVRKYEDAGRYLSDKLQKGLRVITLTGHFALSTAMANDVAADLVFAQQLIAFGREGDVLLAISTSGNSANVCHAIRVAHSLGIGTVGLSGKTGGMVSSLCDTTIKVPETETYKIQELHLPVYHFICIELEKYFFS